MSAARGRHAGGQRGPSVGAVLYVLMLTAVAAAVAVLLLTQPQ